MNEDLQESLQIRSHKSTMFGTAADTQRLHYFVHSGGIVLPRVADGVFASACNFATDLFNFGEIRAQQVASKYLMDLRAVYPRCTNSSVIFGRSAPNRFLVVRK